MLPSDGRADGAPGSPPAAQAVPLGMARPVLPMTAHPAGAAGPATGEPVLEPALEPVLEPVLPDFGGRCLTGIVPGLLGHLAGEEPPPDWLPGPLLAARQVVLLVIDGLGSEQLAARRHLAPVLASGTGTVVTSVAPTTTA